MSNRTASGAHLKASRKRAALTQAQAAHKLDIPRELISMWETETRAPNQEQIEQLARLYRINEGYLHGVEERDVQHERSVLYDSLPTEALRSAFDQWLSFLDSWADLLELLGKELPGPGKPPGSLDHGSPVTDARRAPTLADEVRDYYRLGRNALPNINAYLDERGILVYRASIGPLDDGDYGVAGAFYNHGRLGFCILVNTDASPGRQAFSMGHSYAHALYHYAERGVVCRTDVETPVERFANTFGPHFLVPRKKLRQMVMNVTSGEEFDAYKVVYLATYFRVSYPTTLRRLLTERHITEDQYDRMRRFSPRALAARVGLDADHFREADPAPLALNRYPISVLKTIRQALQTDRILPMEAARLLDVDAGTVEKVLLGDPPLATDEELREFKELPG